MPPVAIGRRRKRSTRINRFPKDLFIVFSLAAVASFFIVRRWNHNVVVERLETKHSFHGSTKLIVLLGERHSGTTYLDRILTHAFFPEYSISKNTYRPLLNFSGCSPDGRPFQSETCVPVLHFKHMFRHSFLSDEEMAELRSRSEILWILAVRNPCNWADGMYREPWGLCGSALTETQCQGFYTAPKLPQKALNGATRLQFLESLEWWDGDEFRNKLNERSQENKTDSVYKNGLFELRKHKLLIMRQLMHAVGPYRYKVVHLADVEKSPELFVKNIANEFGLQRNIKEKLKPSDKQHEIKCFNEDEMHAVEKKIDWKLEEKFGFTLSDCHACID
mmetsp:Transcript_8702/g.12372  ORF Transcript_8702/g.12372 Transcript_8702/m.12372 type:complete len:334 (+) Transcript_8702:46-1047(+)